MALQFAFCYGQGVACLPKKYDATALHGAKCSFISSEQGRESGRERGREGGAELG